MFELIPVSADWSDSLAPPLVGRLAGCEEAPGTPVVK